MALGWCDSPSVQGLPRVNVGLHKQQNDFLLKYPVFKKYLIWDKMRRAAELINQPEI